MDDNVISEKAREARNKYYREWRAKNKDRASAINRKYRENHRDELKAKRNSYWERRASDSANIISEDH